MLHMRGNYWLNNIEACGSLNRFSLATIDVFWTTYPASWLQNRITQKMQHLEIDREYETRQILAPYGCHMNCNKYSTQSLSWAGSGMFCWLLLNQQRVTRSLVAQYSWMVLCAVGCRRDNTAVGSSVNCTDCWWAQRFWIVWKLIWFYLIRFRHSCRHNSCRGLAEEQPKNERKCREGKQNSITAHGRVDS